MYIAITGSKNNKDVYIYRSFRKENGKASLCQILRFYMHLFAIVRCNKRKKDLFIMYIAITGSKRNRTL